MAILKVSSQKESGADAFSASMRYVSDPAKTNGNDTTRSAQSFEDLSVLNRYVHGKENRKRHYKHKIVALEMEWPPETAVRKSFVDKLYKVISACRAYYNDKNFRSIGYVHQDTVHPHIHFIVDTCNVETGKQLTQSSKDLEKFKLFVSEQLMLCGLNETIRMNVSVVSEAEMLEDDESIEVIADSNPYDDYYDYEEYDDYDVNDDCDESDDVAFWRFTVSLSEKALPLAEGFPFLAALDNAIQAGKSVLNGYGLVATGYGFGKEGYFVLLAENNGAVTLESLTECIPGSRTLFSDLKDSIFNALTEKGFNGNTNIFVREVSEKEYQTNEEYEFTNLDSICLKEFEQEAVDNTNDYMPSDPEDYYPQEDYIMSDYEAEEYLARLDEEQYTDWNTGTEEQPGYRFFNHTAESRKEMCVIKEERMPACEDADVSLKTDSPKGKIMCVIVDSSKADSEKLPESKVEMVKIINKPFGNNN